MTITKKALPRRTVLRGIGVSLGLPLLDSMVPALSAARATTQPLRTGFFYVANGVSIKEWHMKEAGPITELSPLLKTLEPFKDQLTEVNGCANLTAEDIGAGPHTKCHSVWLAGVKARRTQGADISLGTTIDQYAARVLGRETPLESLLLATEPSYLVGNCDNGYACTYMNTFSWKTPTTPVPMESHPRVVFERLFGDGAPVEKRLARLRFNRSILDSVSDEIASLEGTLGSGDRTALGEYLTSVREVEQRIQRAEGDGALSPVGLERPMGIPQDDDEYYRLMFDLVFLAYQADLTRVIDFQISRETSTRTYPQIGVPNGHHDVSHHSNNPDLIAQNTKINQYHLTLFASLLDRMQKAPDGDGSLLDHTMILYGGGMGEGNIHDPRDLPVVLVGGMNGRLKGGRVIKVPRLTPMMNLGLSILDKVGLDLDSIGDSTGRIAEL